MSRARAARRPKLGELVTSARARFQRVPERKARSVADLIRGLTVAEAREQLASLHRPSAQPLVLKAINSAAANVSNLEDPPNADELVVGEIFVDGGAMLKRFQPRAMGRACVIRKRSCHLTVKLYTQG